VVLPLITPRLGLLLLVPRVLPFPLPIPLLSLMEFKLLPELLSDKLLLAITVTCCSHPVTLMLDLVLPVLPPSQPSLVARPVLPPPLPPLTIVYHVLPPVILYRVLPTQSFVVLMPIVLKLLPANVFSVSTDTPFPPPVSVPLVPELVPILALSPLLQVPVAPLIPVALLPRPAVPSLLSLSPPSSSFWPPFSEK